ncbi:MAG: SPOR domain-containing protein [Deltaproteobacteria bacterium]|nr:SPOR domain-containing protein [Deltaproteobacteria bacterium]
MKNDSVLVDKRQVFLLFFSSIIIMILVFGAGVFFGKKLSGVAVSSDKPNDVIKVKDHEIRPYTSVVDTGVVDIGEQAVVSVDKNLGKKEEETVKVASQNVEATKVEQVEKKIVPDTPIIKERKEDKKGERQKISTKLEPSPNTKREEITEAKFTLQVGAFPDRSQALKIAAELEKRGYESWIQRARSKDKDIFRVRVGKFATKQEAEKFKQQFDKKERYNSFITPME